MPAMFSWFPGTRAHRFLCVHEGWIKVKAEHRGARGSHLLPPRPGWFVLMFVQGVAQLCRTSFKIQVRIQKLFKKKRERKKNPKQTTTARGDLAHLLASRGCTAAEGQSRGQRGSCNAGTSWSVRGNRCKSSSAPAPSCSACPFSRSTFSVSFIKSSGFALLTQLPLCRLPGRLSPCHMPLISPLSARGAAWSPAPSRHFSPLYVEKFWEWEASLQLLPFAEKPQPLGLSFSWMRAFHRSQLNFKKHW